ncbi:type IV toxin-antitoxin system AbiEi family antitoxin [Pseudoduganella umbonata]|uniref:Uncharacterized protein n=1 Tax=Pseudoduganella umbonata TaxID=864828 RepID=A0A4P8HYE9_9BURK|nr:type IV toxin-antitoxin system AbiEi family antitoxin [Pseudoduganella umbonata]MBB3223398.1 hypothetical protein [Pseudoduganella umbonata]QCP13700.1 hypothetical protein FCL38_27180 [Pseudoduganella umbonata]
MNKGNEMREPRVRGILPPLLPAREQLILEAMAALRDKTAIEAELLAPGADSPQAEARIDLHYDNKKFRYIVECKPLVDRRQLIDQVRRQLPEGSGLLITSYLSRELAHYCREVGQQYMDTCGNAYLRGKGLFVFISGEKDENRLRQPRTPRGLNASGLRVAFVLLTQPRLINAPLKDIAQAAGVALGSAYNMLDELAARGYLLKIDRHQRRLLEPGRLIDEWAINYPFVLRPKLAPRRFTAPDAQWWKTSDEDIPFAWGAEVAANMMTSYLKPATQTLYIEPGHMESALRTLVKRHRLRPDPAGQIEVLEQFWRIEEGPRPATVPPLLVYADLLAILDPRASETVRIIKEKFIDHTFDSP